MKKNRSSVEAYRSLLLPRVAEIYVQSFISHSPHVIEWCSGVPLWSRQAMILASVQSDVKVVKSYSFLHTENCSYVSIFQSCDITYNNSITVSVAFCRKLFQHLPQTTAGSAPDHC